MKINKFIESGQLIESFSANSGGDLIKEAELFSTGTHRGRNYTESDLQALAESFNNEESVPVQLDHSESVKDTVGFLESVSVKGGKLMGKLRIIEEDIKKRVANKLAKKVSISFYTNSTGKPTKIREVSIVAFPQLKGAQMFSEQEASKKADRYLLQMRFKEFEAKLNRMNRQLEVEQRAFAEEKKANEDKKFQEEYDNYLISIGKKEKPIEMSKEEQAYYDNYMNSLGLGQGR